MSATAVDGCLACELLDGRRPILAGTLAETDRWAVEHCVGPLSVGTLIVKPKRHVVHVGDLEVEDIAPRLRVALAEETA